MTDTSKDVTRYYETWEGMEPSIDGDYVTYDDYAALSAQLKAANARAEMLADSVDKARAEGRAEGLREAAHIANSYGSCACDPDMGDAILALIPADTPAKVTVLMPLCECGMTGPCMWGQCKSPLTHAIAGGRDE